MPAKTCCLTGVKRACQVERHSGGPEAYQPKTFIVLHDLI